MGFIRQVVSVMLSREYMALPLLSIAKKLGTEEFRRLRKMSELNVYMVGLNPSALAVIATYLTSPVWL